ncbi:MAG TPA: hypothetical protein VGQ24_14000 [Gemmatimonadales bacterium]|nr:hypothetical protein [Gemmatimonadales bacterium]
MQEIRRRNTRQRLLRAAILGTLGLVTPVAAPLALGQAKPEVPDLSQVRSALRKYEDPYVAIHDGYFSTLGCIVIEQAGPAGHVPYLPGGMGVHFLNLSLLGPVPDPNKPQVLIYEPDGAKLRLVAAEWFIPLSTGVKGRPTLWGRAFDGPMMGHPPLLPMELTHYDLHVWLYKTNPFGTFAPTNPEVTCTGHPYRLVEEAPKLVPEPKP